MPRLGPVTRAELVRKLQALGLDGPFPGKKHAMMVRQDGIPVRVPNTDVDDIDLLSRILRQAGVTRNDFMNA